MISFVRTLFAAAALAAATLPAVAGERFDFGRIEAGSTAGRLLVVDVREPDEFVAGHIPGSVNLPLSRFDAAALPKPEGRTVVLTCRSGRRAGQALAMVEASGRRDVGVYGGSMLDWTARSGPIATGQ